MAADAQQRVDKLVSPLRRCIKALDNVSLACLCLGDLVHIATPYFPQYDLLALFQKRLARPPPSLLPALAHCAAFLGMASQTMHRRMCAFASGGNCQLSASLVACPDLGFWLAVLLQTDFVLQFKGVSRGQVSFPCFADNTRVAVTLTASGVIPPDGGSIAWLDTVKSCEPFQVQTSCEAALQAASKRDHSTRASIENIQKEMANLELDLRKLSLMLYDGLIGAEMAGPLQAAISAVEQVLVQQPLPRHAMDHVAFFCGPPSVCFKQYVAASPDTRAFSPLAPVPVLVHADDEDLVAALSQVLSTHNLYFLVHVTSAPLHVSLSRPEWQTELIRCKPAFRHGIKTLDGACCIVALTDVGLVATASLGQLVEQLRLQRYDQFQTELPPTLDRPKSGRDKNRFLNDFMSLRLPGLASCLSERALLLPGQIEDGSNAPAASRELVNHERHPLLQSQLHFHIPGGCCSPPAIDRSGTGAVCYARRD